MPSIRCFLMSAGSLVGQNIQAIREHIFPSCEIIALNSTAQEPTLKDFEQLVITPETQHPDFLAVFNTLVQQYQPKLIIPCRDEDVLFLAKWHEQQQETGPECLVGKPELALAFYNKLKSHELAQQYQLPFAPTLMCKNLPDLQHFAQTHGLPLLIKPIVGFASRQVFLITHIDQLFAWQNQENFLIQPWLGNLVSPVEKTQQWKNQGTPLFFSFEEDKYAIQLFFDHTAQPRHCFFSRHHMRQGQSMRIERHQACEELKHLAKQCQKAFAGQWRGPLNIQVQRRPQEPFYIYEFNGRFTGASHARALMGFNELDFVWHYFLGHSPLAVPQRQAQQVFKRVKSVPV